MLTGRAAEILEIVRNNPMITQAELAERLSITRSSVATYISRLTDSGHIRGRGYVLNSEPYAVVVGGANLDVEGRPDETMVTGESNIGKVTVSAGGVGRNIAVSLAGMDVPTHLIAALGEDDHGRFVHAETVARGVDCSSVVWSPRYRTASYVSLLRGDGELLAGVNNMDIMEAVGAAALEARRDLIRHATVVVADCNLCESSLAILSDFSRTLFVDCVSEAKATRIRPFLSSVHTLKPNRAEAEALTGMSIHNDTSARDAVMWLLSEGADRVFLTLGREGAIWADRSGRSGRLQAAAFKALSTTGAGDAFTASLVSSHLNGIDSAIAARLAGDAAARVAQSDEPVADPEPEQDSP